MKKLLALLIGLLFVPSLALAQLNTFQGGTGSTSPSGILYGDSTIRLKTLNIGSGLTFSAGTLSATGGSGGTGVATTSLAATFPIIKTLSASAITYSFGGLSTSSPITAGAALLYATGVNTVASVATSTLSASSPLTGSFTQIGSGGSLGIQAASASQAGSMSAGDWSLLHVASTTFSSPLVYTLGTNAVTCPTCNVSSASVTSIATTYPIAGGTITTSGTLTFSGLATTSPWTNGQLAYVTDLNHITSVATGTVSAGSSAITVTAGRSVIGGALSIDCAAAGTSQNGCLSSTDWNTFNGKSGFAFPFTTNAATAFFNAISNSTTTQMHFSGNPVSLSASSTAQFNTSTTTAATINTLYLPNQASALLLTGAAPGLVGTYGGASACSANNFVTTISAIGGTTCGTATISGVSLGGSLFAHTVSGSLTGTSYNGSAAVSDWALNMANANTWTATQTFKNASTTAISGSYSSSTVGWFQKLGVSSSTCMNLLCVGATTTLGSIAVAENIIQPTSTAMTIDWTKGNQQDVQLGTAATAIGFNKASTTGQTLRLIICNPTTTAGAVTFITPILWSGGTLPTQTTTANKCDIWSFILTQGTSTNAAPSVTIIGAQTPNF